MQFYKVIVLKCDIFETVIKDERHFSTKAQADCYAEAVRHTNDIAVVVLMS